MAPVFNFYIIQILVSTPEEWCGRTRRLSLRYPRDLTMSRAQAPFDMKIRGLKGRRR